MSAKPFTPFDADHIDRVEQAFVQIATGEDVVVRQLLLSILQISSDKLKTKLDSIDDAFAKTLQTTYDIARQQVEFLQKFINLLKLALEQLGRILLSDG